ncbi:hypothetical protein AB1L07_02375 [Niallia alba]|uniref:hypothetical protein n=1 Tax=Niallia alba TaxID=2729105 RepID=UPI0039A15A58
MKLINADEFIKWAEKRMVALDQEILRDFGGGMTNKLGHYNELKAIKEMFERGVFIIGDEKS